MNADSQMRLVWPSRDYLTSYVAALERGWSPDNMRPEAGPEELARIAVNADAFLAMNDRLIDRRELHVLLLVRDDDVDAVG